MTSLSAAAWLLAEMIALLVGVTFLISLLRRRLGDEAIQRWMGGPPHKAALKGIVLGAVTPFCTYSAIPVLLGMRQAGVRPAGYTAFLFAAPVVDPILVGALAIIIGPVGAGVYTVAAFTAAFTLALIVDAVDITPHLKPVPALAPASAPSPVAAHSPATAHSPVVTQPVVTQSPTTAHSPAVATYPAATNSPAPAALPESAPALATTGPTAATAIAGAAGSPAPPAPCSTADTDPQPWRGWRAEAPGAWRRALELLRGMAWLVVVGVAVGLGISLAVPADSLVGIAGSQSPLAVPIAAAVGVPFYVGTELFIPIGDALRNSGVGVGAIVALTIAGAGANLPEFALLTKLARGRLVAAFFAYVFFVAVLGGLVTDLVL